MYYEEDSLVGFLINHIENMRQPLGTAPYSETRPLQALLLVSDNTRNWWASL